MNTRAIFSRVVVPVALMASVLAACSGNKMEPAQQAIAEARSALSAAGPDAIKYIPNQVAAVASEIERLDTLFENEDYEGVLAAAGDVLAQAQAIPAAAESAREAALAAFSAEWESIAHSAPSALSAIQSRVDILSAAAKLPEEMDAAQFESIRTELREAQDLWSKAAAAHAAGELEKATALGLATANKAEQILTVLGMSPG
jgi:hypothetical protein